MSDPKHWLDDGGGATAGERELLRAARDRRMPAALRSSVWGSIAAGVAVIETAAAAGAAGAAAGTAVKQGAAAKGVLALLSGTATVKGIAAIAIAGGVGFGVMSLGSSSGSRPSQPAEIANAAMATAPPPSSIAANVDDGERDTAPPVGAKPSAESVKGNSDGAKQRVLRAAPSGVRGAAASAARRNENDSPPAEVQESRRVTRLAAEAAAVVAIRKTLVSGRPQEALRLLDQARLDFADGGLAQEREALTVRALWQADQKDAARTRGDAFLRAFPRSPHAAELRALLER